jgi:hypothetical protein
LVSEEVRYDFSAYPKYADGFVRNLIRLMIIAKLNCSARSAVSKAFFLDVVSQIPGSEAYIVNYGQPLLYVKYRGVPFTDQKVGCRFIRLKDHVVDVTVESIFADFVKRFDELASSSESQVHWGVVSEPIKTTPTAAEEQQQQNREDLGSLFMLLDAFVDSVARLSVIPSSSPDSLQGKRLTIRNAIVSKKSLDIELLVDNSLNIVRISPLRKKRKDAVNMLMTSSESAKALLSLMIQA